MSKLIQRILVFIAMSFVIWLTVTDAPRVYSYCVNSYQEANQKELREYHQKRMEILRQRKYYYEYQVMPGNSYWTIAEFAARKGFMNGRYPATNVNDLQIYNNYAHLYASGNTIKIPIMNDYDYGKDRSKDENIRINTISTNK